MATLIYEKFKFEYPVLSYYYKYNENTYINKLIFNGIIKEKFDACPAELLNNIFAHIGACLSVFLFPLENFEKIIVMPIMLSKEGVDFFEDFMEKGLREFRYRNKLLFNRINIESGTNSPSYSPVKINPTNKAVLMNGGGKDSAVACEVLNKISVKYIWFTLIQNDARRKVIELSGNGYVDSLKWKMDPNIKIHGKYRGHKPLSANLAFISLIIASLNRCKYIVTANEISANYGNMVHMGFDVNHQYSKSFEFEINFSNYINRHIISDIQYFSILRPLHEIQVAKIFSYFPKYFSYFNSCNKGQHKGYWCKDCPKCAFLALCLAPFLRDAELSAIFGDNIFSEENINKRVVKLTNGKVKPFECVGTQDECKLAFMMLPPRYRAQLPVLEDVVKDISFQELKNDLIANFERPHNFPPELASRINLFFQEYLADPTGSSEQ